MSDPTDASALLTRDPQYQPIWDAISAALAKGARNVNFWDGNHGSSVPRDVIIDRGLYDAISPYGKPLYVYEDASPGVNPLIARYRNGSDADRAQIEGHIASFIKRDADSNHMGRMVFDLLRLDRAGAIDLFDPDPRGALLPALNFTPEELNAYKKFLVELGRDGSGCLPQILDGIREGWSSQDKENLEVAMQKFMVLFKNGKGQVSLSTEEVDAQIGKAVAGFRRTENIPAGTVQVTLYGEEHFAKKKDLDERFPGISIAVMDAPGSLNILTRDAAFRDVPDYVWYANEKRLVKLDTAKAREEFLGPQSSAEFKTLVPSQSDVRQQCLKATEHLRSHGNLQDVPPEEPLQPSPPANAPVKSPDVTLSGNPSFRPR